MAEKETSNLETMDLSEILEAGSMDLEEKSSLSSKVFLLRLMLLPLIKFLQLSLMNYLITVLKNFQDMRFIIPF